MQRFEYRVIPAPRRGEKARGVKTTEDRFALALTGLMNRLGAEGWDYVRADALPCEERVGLTGTKTVYQNMLVFRRVLAAGAEAGAAAGAVAGGGAPLGAPPVGEAPVGEAPVGEAGPVLRFARDAAGAPPLRLGAAEAPSGAAPSLGPAKPGLAAE